MTKPDRASTPMTAFARCDRLERAEQEARSGSGVGAHQRHDEHADCDLIGDEEQQGLCDGGAPRPRRLLLEAHRVGDEQRHEQSQAQSHDGVLEGPREDARQRRVEGEGGQQGRRGGPAMLAGPVAAAPVAMPSR